MNANLLAIVKQIVAEQGEGVLSEPRRISAFFADLAKDEPKPQKNAFVKCLEHGFAQTFKNAAEPDRSFCKQRLAQKLHDEEGLDLGLCEETVELLATVLFANEQKKKENLCKSCGKELQEEWKICPYCSTPVASHVVKDDEEKQQDQSPTEVTPVISSESDGGKDDIEQIKPETPVAKEPAVTPVSSGNTADQNNVKLTGVQKFFVFLGAVGGVIAYCYFLNGVVNMDKIISFDSIWAALCGVAIMHYIFKGYNNLKKKKP